MTEQQLQAYVVWVNCQLKKKPGTRPVQDLGSDMQDGVALAHLIEILALEKLEGIHVVPSGVNDMLDNVEKVIQFMVNRRIRMHHTTAKDIVEGNIKSIMRLILAVAAHFKPNSVKQAPTQYGATSSLAKGSPRQTSVAGIAQGAANTLAEARQEVINIPHRPRRPWQLTEEQRQRTSHSQASDSDRSGLISRSVRSRDREELEGASSGSSPRSSATGSPRIPRRLEYPVPKSRSQDFPAGQDITSSYEDEHEEIANRTIWDDLLEERNELVDELDDTKSALLKLQELLLNGEQPDGDSSNTSLPIEGDTPQDEVVIYKSKLQQTEHLCRELREELSRVKTDCMELQGAKSGTLVRLSDKEKALTQLNREVLRLGFAQQSLETEKVELEKQLLEKDRVIAEYKKELLHRDRQIEDLVSDGSSEMQVVMDTLQTLRSSLTGSDPQQQAIDRLEQSIANLMDKLMLADHPASHLSDSSSPSRGRLNYDSTGDIRRSPITSIQGYPVQRLEADSSTGNKVSPHSTKILYFTDRTVTPFMCTIGKRLGDVRLRDIKAIFDRQGLYRYHFKAMDPEFGTVKEEITQDEAVIPGWEGKIVAWIEEDDR